MFGNSNAIGSVTLGFHESKIAANVLVIVGAWRKGSKNEIAFSKGYGCTPNDGGRERCRL